MLTPRFGHSATLLTDGRVLIAGGRAECVLGIPCLGVNSAELYDPATGTFTATGVMTTVIPIGGVSLPDGRVLFGESYFTGAQAAVELYDPSTGSFKVAGQAQTLTQVYSVIVLNDGRALLNGVTGKSAAAEFFDPTAGTFSPIIAWPANMPGYPVAVLVDGRVLFDSNQIYDPATGAFTALPKRFFDFYNDTPPVTLLPSGELVLTGGNTDGGNVNWAYQFDPATGMFPSTGTMSTVRDAHTSTLLPDGTVLIAGGATTYNPTTQSDNLTASAEIYDPASGQFAITGPMNAPRANHAAVVLNDGRVLISGGLLSAPPYGPRRVFEGSTSAEIYTPTLLVPAPVLFSLSDDGKGPGTIWHAATGQIASANNPAIAGEALSMYTTSLADGGVIPPQVAVAGRVAEILFFGHAPGFPGYNQVNFRVPNGVAPGSDVSVRLTYLGRPSNQVTMGVR